MSAFEVVKHEAGNKIPWHKPILEENEKLFHALLLAREYRVFPVAENAKKPPMFREWQIQATRDEDQIRNWWGQWPNANIGRPADGLAVDVDPRNNAM
jgi:hypothetical protein